jgi:DNA-binding XRE family transcriptional regulator
MLIQKLRLKRGWSQQQLADAVGLPRTSLVLVEKGEQPIKRGEVVYEPSSEVERHSPSRRSLR